MLTARGEAHAMSHAPEQRPEWGTRCAGCALAGGLVGGFVACAAVIVTLWMGFASVGPRGVTVGETAAWFFQQGPAPLMSFAVGAAAGAGLGLVAWLVWWIRSRR
jgi:hypothetical protein